MVKLKGKSLFRASTLLAAIGFLLFGYDQVKFLFFYTGIDIY